MNNRIPKVGLIKIRRRSGNYYRLRYRLPGNKNHTYENVGYTSKNRAEVAQAQLVAWLNIIPIKILITNLITDLNWLES